MLYAAFAILLVIFSVASPWFLSLDNFLNIGRQTALVTIIATGMTFVIISRQIDLSVGSTLALSGMAAALAMSHLANNWLVGAVAGIGAGALVGLINGLLTTRLAIPSFLVTLGTLSAARGLALMVTNTKPVIITNETYFAIFGEGRFAGVPAPIAWTLLAIFAGVLLLHYTVYGRQIYAAGGNPTAARYSGIYIERVTTIAFVLTGMLAGLAALVLSARSHAARPDPAEARLLVTGCAAEIDRVAITAMPEVDGVVANRSKLDPRAWNVAPVFARGVKANATPARLLPFRTAATTPAASASFRRDAEPAARIRSTW